ncbi:efflux RND transporter permease subunit, partial [Klebsiella pneumoniae]|uniref:efflux RND transporter permease subunit n=1 Tax=Klebsiella pneumoniae TaxID=573 RepID=UPI003B981C8D
MTVTKQVKADTITTVALLEKEIEKFKSRLPSGYEIKVYTNEANRVEADLYIVQFNAVLGLLLILIVLLILLPGTIGFVASF